MKKNSLLQVSPALLQTCTTRKVFFKNVDFSHRGKQCIIMSCQNAIFFPHFSSLCASKSKFYRCAFTCTTYVLWQIYKEGQNLDLSVLFSYLISCRLRQHTYHFLGPKCYFITCLQQFDSRGWRRLLLISLDNRQKKFGEV